MTWVLAAVVLYLLASLWTLRRGQAREARIMRAHIMLLWRRVQKRDHGPVPVDEVYQQLKELGMKDDEAWHYSGADDAAVRFPDEPAPMDESSVPRIETEDVDELDVESAQKTASDDLADLAFRGYLLDEVSKRRDRAIPLWRMRHAEAALALDELEEEHYGPLPDDPVAADDSLEDSEIEKMDEEWAQKYARWKEQYPAAARAYDDMMTEVSRELHQYEAIRNMPEMKQARKRDREQRDQARPC